MREPFGLNGRKPYFRYILRELRQAQIWNLNPELNRVQNIDAHLKEHKSFMANGY